MPRLSPFRAQHENHTQRKPEARLDQTREVVEGHERFQLFTKASRTEEIPNQAVVRSPDAMDNLALCRPGVGAGGAKESSAAGQAAPTTKAGALQGRMAADAIERHGGCTYAAVGDDGASTGGLSHQNEPPRDRVLDDEGAHAAGRSVMDPAYRRGSAFPSPARGPAIGCRPCAS